MKDLQDFVKKDASPEIQSIRYRNYKNTRTKLLGVIENTLFGSQVTKPSKEKMQPRLANLAHASAVAASKTMPTPSKNN